MQLYRATEGKDKLLRDIGVKNFSSLRFAQRIPNADRFLMPPQRMS